MIRVLLVDDHTAIRQALAFLFAQDQHFNVVGQAGTLAEARILLTDVDVAIVDLDLPDGNGVDLIHDLHAQNPKGMVLILTASSDRLHHARAVEAGAAGVMHKSAQAAEIIDATRRLSEGEFLLTPTQIIELMHLAGQHREQNRDAQNSFARLTPREREVLRALAQGLSDKEIAQQLQISHETQRTHIVNLLGKLGVHSRLEALVFALRHGIVTIS
ncbi:MAG: response regulator transcription factor [Roseiflexaceae bacterium]|nr:response regulator transcription factor [Roseiflexaceae bacterium]